MKKAGQKICEKIPGADGLMKIKERREARGKFTLNLCHEIRQEREPCHGQVEGWSWTTKKPVDLAYSNLRIIQLLAALSAMSSDN